VRYLLGRRASRDLDEIVRYIAKDGPAAAERWLESIFVRFDELAATPFVGRRRDDLGSGHRSIVFGQYVIVYTVQKSVVRVAHIIHGKRDLGAVLES
jgi:toxin ParE1/3/4